MKHIVLFISAFLMLCSSAAAQYATPNSILDAWVEAWATYDLSSVDDLFENDPSTTYFSSEIDGLIVGFDRVREHHEGFGFVDGGGEASATLWVDDVVITSVGDAATIAAIWHFGESEDQDTAQYGPMTMVVNYVDGGYRITHMHFGNYPQE